MSISSNGYFLPDVLLATDSPQTIPGGESKVVWLIAHSTDARAGLYDYRISIKAGADRYLVPLRVAVHDVTLSKETPLSTGNWSYLSGSLERRSRETLIRDEMLDNRITTGVGHSIVPQKDEEGKVIRPARHDTKWLQQFLEFHKDFPLIGFYYPFSQNISRPQHDWFGPVEWMDEAFKEIFGELMTGIVQQIKASGRDYDGFYFQMFDETMSHKVVEICKLFHSFDPNVQILATVHRASEEATKHFVEGGIKFFLHHASELEYDNASDGYPTLGSDERQLWIYGAIDNTFGHGKERDPLIYYRYMHWAAYRHNVNGVWFWDMVNPNGRSNGWIDENESQVFHPMVYTTFDYGWQSGQGVPADVKTVEQVIPSRRWRYSRMGIEDYMLLKMAQDNIDNMGAGGNAYKKQLDAIVKSVLKNRCDRKLFHRKRKELVELVEALAK